MVGRRPIMRTALREQAQAVIYRGFPRMNADCVVMIETILTFSWRMPLISDEFWGYEFAQPVGDGCSVGTQLLWPRTEVRKRAAIPSQLLSGLRPTGGR